MFEDFLGHKRVSEGLLAVLLEVSEISQFPTVFNFLKILMVTISFSDCIFRIIFDKQEYFLLSEIFPKLSTLSVDFQFFKGCFKENSSFLFLENF